jgi:hypothetical protein
VVRGSTSSSSSSSSSSKLPQKWCIHFHVRYEDAKEEGIGIVPFVPLLMKNSVVGDTIE